MVFNKMAAEAATLTPPNEDREPLRLMGYPLVTADQVEKLGLVLRWPPPKKTPLTKLPKERLRTCKYLELMPDMVDGRYQQLALFIANGIYESNWRIERSVDSRIMIELIDYCEESVIQKYYPDNVWLSQRAKNSVWVIVGDIHGQFNDLRKIMELTQQELEKNNDLHMIFLGDIVDRGPHSFPAIMYIISLMVLFPTRIHLLRGNHELQMINRIYGLHEEMRELNVSDVYLHINDLFVLLPICARVKGTDTKTLWFCHGGIGPMQLEAEEPIECIIVSGHMGIEGELAQNMYTDVQNSIMWSDPRDYEEGGDFVPSERGAGYSFNTAATKKFLKKVDATHMIRAHQTIADGAEWKQDGKLLTVFSASNYCGRLGNKGAIAVWLGDDDIKINNWEPLTTRMGGLPFNVGSALEYFDDEETEMTAVIAASQQSSPS